MALLQMDDGADDMPLLLYTLFYLHHRDTIDNTFIAQSDSLKAAVQNFTFK